MKLKTINTRYLKTLNPCQDRLDNWLEHYPNWSGSLARFLNLKKITHEDKLWVFFRSIDRSTIRLVAADFAEVVLPIYESKYPNDHRPRKAIEAVRTGINIRDSADAAYAADHAAYAARSATYAVYAAARSATYAVYAAAQAAYSADSAAYAAAHTAYVAAKNSPGGEKAAQQRQIKIMKEYL